MPATAQVTSELYLALADEFDQHGNRIQEELIGGEIVRLPAASQKRDPLKNGICKILRKFLDPNQYSGLEANVEIGAQVRGDRNIEDPLLPGFPAPGSSFFALP